MRLTHVRQFRGFFHTGGLMDLCLNLVLQELDDIDHGKKMNEHFEAKNKKLRDSINLEELLNDIEEVKRETDANEVPYISGLRSNMSKESIIPKDKKQEMHTKSDFLESLDFSKEFLPRSKSRVPQVCFKFRLEFPR